jgi:predicted nucleotidyltransferase
MHLPSEKQTLLDKIVDRLSAVQGVKAVALGGSYARGTQRLDSDLDIALYYLESEPFQIDQIRRVAADISTQGTPDVTDFYGWGAWVNGGAWIQTSSGKVDFLYRNLDQVQSTIDDAIRGITAHDFNQQPAYGFYSVIYLAETAVCLLLYDPEGRLARLKDQVAVYPPLLKEKTIASALWLAEFSLLHAAGYASNGDVYATTGALTRVASYLTQALFALNETYFMNDKTAMKEIAGFSNTPTGYVERLSAILAHPGSTAGELENATRLMSGLWSEVVALTDGSYQPAFRLLF